MDITIADIILMAILFFSIHIIVIHLIFKLMDYYIIEKGKKVQIIIKFIFFIVITNFINDSLTKIKILDTSLTVIITIAIVCVILFDISLCAECNNKQL